MQISRNADLGLTLTYHLRGRLDRLAIPAPEESGSADGLWEHTCFEAFLATTGSPAYHEFNFSPSGKWAHYAFSGYRQREEQSSPLPAPEISVCHFPDVLELQATLAAALLPQESAILPLQLGLSAVVETLEGQRSYWALAHPGPLPDFHHRNTFLFNLK